MHVNNLAVRRAGVRSECQRLAKACAHRLRQRDDRRDVRLARGERDVALRGVLHERLRPVQAAGVVLAVGRDRRKLLGLDAPTAVTVDASVSITGIDDTVRRILDSALPVEVVDVEDFPVPDVSPALRLRTDTPPAED